MEDFVTYDQAYQLKQLGFDWECNHYYQENDKSFHQNFYENHSKHTKMQYKGDNTFIKVTLCSAPTLPQVQKWFRGRGIIIIIGFSRYSDSDQSYYFDIKRTYNDRVTVGDSVDTYEQALLLAIDKAIEIFKKEK